MDAISLLPPEIRQQRQARQRAALCLWSGLAVLAVLLCVYATLWVQTYRERRAVNDLRAKAAGVNAEIQRYQQYARLQENIDQLKRTIEQAKGVTPDWASVMAAVAASLPDGVWLTDVVSTSPNAQGSQGDQASKTVAAPGKKALSIQGWAGVNRQVAEYLSRLQQAPGLSNVSCRLASEEDFNGRKMIRFEILAELQDDYPGDLPDQGGVP